MLALWFAVAYYAPFLLIAVAILLFAASAPLSCLWITAFLMLVSQAFMSLHGSPWFDLVAETIPRHEIGRLLGYRNAVSAFAGIFAGAVCSAALKSFHFPANFAFVYALAVAVFVLASYSFSMVDEIPAYAVPKERTRPGQYLRGLFSVLRTDGNYRSYLSYGFLGRLASAAGPFYALAATQRLGGDPALAAGGFVVAASLAKIGGNIGLPYFTRRFGNKRMMAVGVIAGALGACIAAFAPSWHWYFATFSLFGVSMAAAAVSGTPFVMSVFPRSRRVGYLALQNLLLGAPMLVLGPAAGVFLERFGHPALFALAAGATLLSLLPLSRCRARAPESGENSVKE
jgi:Na+/melibiose symporter-like transporter